MTTFSQRGRTECRGTFLRSLGRKFLLFLIFFIIGYFDKSFADEFRFDLGRQEVLEFSVQQYRLTPPVAQPGYDPRIYPMHRVGRIQYRGKPVGLRYRDRVPFSEQLFVYPHSSPLHTSGGYPIREGRWQMTSDHWTVKHGLPVNKVSSLCRTSDGFLWVGTENGLARFDGMSFRVYDRENTALMREFGSRVEALFEDDEGTLWLGLNSGLIRYFNGGFESLQGQESLRGVRVKGFAARSKGGIWVATRQGLYIWDGRDLKPFWIEGIGTEIQTQVVVEDGSTLWIGTLSGLLEYDLDSDELVERHFVPGRDVVSRMPAIRVMQIVSRSDQSLWVGTADLGLWRRPAGKSEFEPVTHTPEWSHGISWPQITRFDLDREGNVWLVDGGVSTGLAVIPFGESQIRPPAIGGTIGQGFAVLCDFEGAIWIGSREGLFRVKRLPFSTFWYDGAGQSNSFSMGNRSICEGPNGGLIVVRSESVLIWSGTHLVAPSLRSDSGPSNTGFFDAEGNLWVGHGWGGITQLIARDGYSRLTSHVEPRLNELGEISTNYVRARGGQWIGNSEGVYLTEAPYEYAKPVVKEVGWVSTLCEDRLGRLWIGTREKGLFQWEAGKLTAFGLPDGLPSLEILSLDWDRDTLWIGTGRGLCRYQEGHIQNFAGVSGMPEHPIGGLIVDRFGALWMNHDAGLSRVMVGELDAYGNAPSKTLQPAIAHYDSEDGMLSVQNVTFAEQLCLEASDGRLWFAKASNLVSTDPEKFIHAAPPPIVLIEEIRANGVFVPFDHEAIIPAEGRRVIEIDFVCTSLYAPNRLLIEYQLDGVDLDWRRADANRKAVYPLLPPGKFIFRVRARNHEGRWSKNEGTVSIVALPRYWETIAFRFVLGIAAIGLVVTVGLWRIQVTRRRMEQRGMERLLAERERIASEIHDQLGSVIAQAAKSNLTTHELETLVKDAVVDLRNLIWSINPEDESLDGLVDIVAGYSSRFTAVVGLRLDLDLPDLDSERKLDPKIRINLASILKEALTNVTKHAGAQRVWVRLLVDDRQLELRVSDDGCGLGDVSVSNGGGQPGWSGMGLSNMALRASDLGGHFRSETRPGGRECGGSSRHGLEREALPGRF